MMMPIMMWIMQFLTAETFTASFSNSVGLLGPQGRLSHASGFSFAPEGAPEETARAFLGKHGQAFGISTDQELMILQAPAKPEGVSAIRFSRQIEGWPIFGGDVVLGMGPQGEVFVVNSLDLPPKPEKIQFVVSEQEAKELGVASVCGSNSRHSVATAEMGLYPTMAQLRPAWRIYFTTWAPAGSFRVSVDAETKAILNRSDLLTFANGNVFEISPVESLTQQCPLSGTVHTRCVGPLLLPFSNLTSSTNLTGSRVTVYNCKGKDPMAEKALSDCLQVAAPTGQDFNFQPDIEGNDKADSFAEVMAYYQIDEHVRYFEKIDSQIPSKLGSIPAYVNSYQTTFGTSGQQVLMPMDNAAYDPINKRFIFGQGTGVDLAYEADIAYHEMTHAVVFSLNQMQDPDYDAYGLNLANRAINEGLADYFAAAHSKDSQIGEYFAGSDLIKSPFLRDINSYHTCAGDGTLLTKKIYFVTGVDSQGNAIVEEKTVTTINGLVGEEHDDGEVWSNFFWASHQGLKDVSTAGKCSGCSAAELIFIKAVELTGTNPSFKSHASTVSAAAKQLFSVNPIVGEYIDCMIQRHQLQECNDARAVPIYKDESKYVYCMDNIPPIQVRVNVPGVSATVKACGYQSWGKLYLRHGQPVTFTSQVVGEDRTFEFQKDMVFDIRAHCDGNFDSTTLTQAGDWYGLVFFEGLQGDQQNVESGMEGHFLVKAGEGVAARPTPVQLLDCVTPCETNCADEEPNVADGGDAADGEIDGGDAGDTDINSSVSEGIQLSESDIIEGGCGCGAMSVGPSLVILLALVILVIRGSRKEENNNRLSSERTILLGGSHDSSRSEASRSSIESKGEGDSP